MTHPSDPGRTTRPRLRDTPLDFAGTAGSRGSRAPPAGATFDSTRRGGRQVGGIFLNYRTGDGDWAAVLVKRELSGRFGADNVFYAAQSIRLGEDFSQRILGRLRQCEVLLALVGPRWLTAEEQSGGRRLDNPDDWVRREISAAFQARLRVIPVLLDGIPRLDETTLPDEIEQLARCQYLRVSHRSDQGDLTRLVDELMELVPGLVTARQLVAQPGAVSSFWHGSAPHQGHDNAGDELRSTVTQLREALSSPGGRVAVEDLVHAAAGDALDALATHDPPAPTRVDDSDIPALLEERLSSCENDMAPLLRMVAIGVCSDDRQHDDLWIAVVKRFLDRRDVRSPRTEEDYWPTEAYPALLLTYTVGVSGMAVARDDLVYRLLARTSAQAVNGYDVPVMNALALRRVVDPRHAGAMPKWDDKTPHQAFSVHLRQCLHSMFFNVLNGRDYEYSFADYEYLRTLLEFHAYSFSSLGEFAVKLGSGDTAVGRRMTARLAPSSALLRSGAFDGDLTQVETARAALQEFTNGRYE